MKVEINIAKKHLYILVALILTLIAIVGVSAYNDAFNKAASQAATFGHSADEVVIEIDGEIKTIQESFDSIASVYTHWGNTNCPAGGEKVYDGWAAGSYHSHSGPQMRCMPQSPNYGTYNDRNSDGQLFYPVQIRTNGYDLGTTFPNDAIISCAVCYVPRTSVTMDIVGINNCPSGWTEQYDGYYVGGYYSHANQDEICLDDDFNSLGTGNGQGIVYQTEMQCNSAWCESNTDYVHDRELTCVVCSK